ncbi:hypothetical protein Taro_030313 [Colocasia esculenta]|uniref:Uncharacterized protein n=1 Tax=Colocasia esculenta TaxID=4460 RepID=A0A843W2Z3_COLES|nr:hypothetical protein [Colocasia esculenta]
MRRVQTPKVAMKIASCDPGSSLSPSLFGLPLIDFKWTVCAGHSRRTGEKDVLLVVDSQLPSHQELLHTTPASCKLVPRVWVKSI